MRILGSGPRFMRRQKVNTAEIRIQEEDFGTLGLSGRPCGGRKGLKFYWGIGGNKVFPKIKKKI